MLLDCHKKYGHCKEKLIKNYKLENCTKISFNQFETFLEKWIQNINFIQNLRLFVDGQYNTSYICFKM